MITEQSSVGNMRSQMSSSEHHSDASHNWLVFFFVCFAVIMGIGAWAIFGYKVDAPEPKPSGGGHGGMILPMDGEWAPHARIWPTA